MKSFRIDDGERYNFPLLKKIPGDAMAKYMFASRFIKNKSVIDIGCGYGYGSAFMAKNGAKDVLGIDCNEEVIQFANSLYNDPNLIFSAIDILSLSSPVYHTS